MHKVLRQNFRTFPNDILLPRKINTFWSGSIIRYVILSLYMLNCFKYSFSIYFETKCLKK